MKVIASKSKKAYSQVGNLFAISTSDKMHYVNQSLKYSKSGELSLILGVIPFKTFLKLGLPMDPSPLRQNNKKGAYYVNQ